jgi:Co/Zn/Cd efflux system component
VHDLHVWSITVGKVALSGHLIVEGGHQKGLLGKATEAMGRRFKIYHCKTAVLV